MFVLFSVYYQNEGLLAADVVAVGKAVLHFEALRTETPDAVAADSSFLTLLGRLVHIVSVTDDVICAVFKIV